MVVPEFINQQAAKPQKKTFIIKDNIIVANTPKPETDSIAKIILNTFDRDPKFVFQIDVQTGQKTTFAEMKDESIRCALWLKKQGIKKDDVVTIATPLYYNDYVPFLATLFVNAIYNPWYYKLSPAMFKHYFQHVQPKIMFVCEESIDMLSKIAEEMDVQCKFVVYGKHPKFLSLSDLLAQQNNAEVESFQPVESIDPRKQVGIVHFSSGTTGMPRPTMLSYDTILHNRRSHCFVRPGANMLWYSPLAWITGTGFFLSCIRQCATRILHTAFNPEEMSKVVEKYKVNWLYLTPSMLAETIQYNVFNRHDYASVEAIMTSGSKPIKSIYESVRKALPQAVVSNIYGMTETGGPVAMQTRDCKIIDSIGYIIEGVMMKVIDISTGRSLGPNQQGELLFKSVNLMLGYYKNQEATEEVFDSEGWLHTGDLGYYDEDGEIFVTDRIKRVIITKNRHISSTKIEEILMEHPDVKEAVVVPIPHQIDIERPFAFVKKVPRAKVTAEELKELPVTYNEYLRITGGVAFIDDFVYTFSGKKDIKALKQIAEAYVCESN